MKEEEIKIIPAAVTPIRHTLPKFERSGPECVCVVLAISSPDTMNPNTDILNWLILIKDCKLKATQRLKRRVNSLDTVSTLLMYLIEINKM